MEGNAPNPTGKYLTLLLVLILFLMVGFTVLAFSRYDMGSSGWVPLIIGPITLLPVSRKARFSEKSAKEFWLAGFCWAVILVGGTLMLEMLHAR